jgi:hypothetical protein
MYLIAVHTGALCIAVQLDCFWIPGSNPELSGSIPLAISPLFERNIKMHVVFWDRTRDCCNFGILTVRRSYLSDRSHLILSYLNLVFMWSHVCQSNSPQTQTPALLNLPLFGCLCGPTFASRTPRRRRPRHC